MKKEIAIGLLLLVVGVLGVGVFLTHHLMQRGFSRRLSKGTIEETDLHDGKSIRVKRMMIDPADLKTVNTIVADSVTGASAVLVATKQ